MGYEATCRALWNGMESSGLAQLETDYVLFRGDFRVKLRFSEIQSAAAEDSALVLRAAEGVLSLELKAAAAKWAERILRPKSLGQKLGLKPGMRVFIVNVNDPAFEGQVAAGGCKPAKNAQGADLIFLGAENARDLDRMHCVARDLAPTAALWMVYPKGRREIREGDVLGEGRAAGLKDVKVAAFSGTHTALKFVLPVPARSPQR